MPRSSSSHGSDSTSQGVALAAVAFVIAILYLAQEVLLPVALSILLSFLLTPLVTRFERLGLGRIPSVILAVGMAFALIGGIGWIVTQQMLDLVNQLPRYSDTLTEKIHTLRSSVSSSPRVTRTFRKINKELSPDNPDAQAPPHEGDDVEGEPGSVRAPLPGETRRGTTPETPLWVREAGGQTLPLTVLTDWLGPILSPLGTAAIVVLFVIFILLQREDLRDRAIRLAGTGRVYVTTQAFNEAAGRVSRYLLMQLIVNATYGVAIALGLWIIGLPNAFLWGLLATVLRFIPYVGPWVAAVMPILLSLAVFHGWTRPLMTIGLYVVVELLSNNVMEPWLYGASTGLSAVGIILAAVFWTWLWGPVGLVLSTPLTVCIVVLGRHVPRLNFLHILFSDEPALELNVRFYQRLLAFDFHEAQDLVDSFLKTGSLDELYEGMLIPALSLAERDRHAGRLSDQQQRFIQKTIRNTVDDLREEFDMTAAAEAVPEGAAATAEAETDQPVPRALRILCIPAEDRADRLAGRMLVQLLTARGHTAETVSVNITSGMLPGILAEKTPDVVIISALAPGGAMQAASGCRKIHPRFPELKIIVGLWNARGPLTKIRQRLETLGARLVTTSLTEGLHQVQADAEPAPVAP